MFRMEIHHLRITGSLTDISTATTTHSLRPPKNRCSGAKSSSRRLLESAMTLTMTKNVDICPKSIFRNQLSKQPTMCGSASELYKQMSLYFSILKNMSSTVC